MSSVSVVALVAGVLAAAHAACPANVANGLRSTGTAGQLVTVVAPSSRSTHGSLRLWRRAGGCWVAAAPAWGARLGRKGVSAHRREGDGTTPAGTFGFGPVMYGVAPDPGVRYRYHRLVCGDWWDEDAASPTYNTFRHVACGARPPFGGGSEALWRITGAYRHFALIRYNTAPVVPGRGSAIFLHVDTGAATNGCVSLPLGRLVTVLRWLDPAKRPLIAIVLSRSRG
jgi:L,D-peptidoglycan transpeptidase YkuD (ErfK/YbiS/YcfS/YnhG family)